MHLRKRNFVARQTSKKAIVVVAGVKFTKAKRRFDHHKDVRYFELRDGIYKMNAAAGSVLKLHDEYEIIGQGASPDEAHRLEQLGLLDKGRYCAVNLLNKEEVKNFVAVIGALKEQTGLPVHLVHYGSASEVQTTLPKGSLRHSVWEAPGEAVSDLVLANCATLLNILQEMKRQNIFEGQEVSKVVSLSAVAAVRPLAKLSLDSIQKAAGHSLMRTLALELTREKIFVTEIMAGSTDGGYYDNDATFEISLGHSKDIGYAYAPKDKPVFTADQIGDAVRYVVDARCNVREVVLIPYGQYPHLGA